MTPNVAIFFSVAALLLSLAGGLATYFGFYVKLKDEIKEVGKDAADEIRLVGERLAKAEGKMVMCEQHSDALKAIPQMAEEMARLSEQSKVYWEVIAPKLRDIIHSPIHKTRDRLVDMLIENKIDTLDDANTLHDELEKLWDETENPLEQVAATAFLARTEWLIKELERKEGFNGSSPV